jgi:PhnB protein
LEFVIWNLSKQFHSLFVLYANKLKITIMSRVSTYLNFPRNTEEAFNFYKSVFGGEFSGGGIMRMGDVPPEDGVPPLAEEDKNLIMHIELPILDGHKLMGTDAPESMGFKLNFGNNSYITLDPDSLGEAKRIFYSLSEGGQIEMDLQKMFWDAYYGTFTDKFGVRWMINCTAK